MKKLFILLVFVGGLVTSGYAQVKLGIKLGVNMANEISSFDKEGLEAAFQKDNLMGLTAGPSAEFIIPKVNLGLETGILFSQKGANFDYDIDNATDAYHIQLKGYKNSNYFEVPVNVKWKFGFGSFKGYLAGGPYFGYALGSKVIVESAVDVLNNNQSIDALVRETAISPEETDWGFNIGAGIEFFRTLQLGVNYGFGLKNTTRQKAMDAILTGTSYSYAPGDLDLSSQNRVFSIILSYYF
jgi:hypothetical protein